MKNLKKKISLSHLIKEISLKIEDDTTLSQMLSHIGNHAHSLIIFFFSIPFLQPVPLPGLSIVLGLVMALSGVGVIIGKNLVLPEWIAKRKLPSHIIKLMFNAVFQVISRCEYLIRPRLPHLVENKITKIIAGILIIISALFLALPLPPGTNFPPALVCFFLAYGLLEKDFLLIVIGTVLFSLEIATIGYVIKLVKLWFMEN